MSESYSWIKEYSRNGKWERFKKETKRSQGRALWEKIQKRLDEETIKRVEKFDIELILGEKWHHKIELAQGVFSPGTFRMDETFKQHEFKSDMSGMDVLDLGSADGYFSVEFAKLGANVLAVDAWDRMIDHVDFISALFNMTDKIKTLNVETHRWETDNQFDLIFVSHVFGHHSSVGAEALAIHIHKLLKDDGEIIVATNTSQKVLNAIDGLFKVKETMKYSGSNRDIANVAIFKLSKKVL